MKNTRYFRNLVVAAPFIILTIFVYVWIAFVLSIDLDMKLVALGALGWWIALLLRLPVAFLTKNMDRQKSQRFVILASGPAEESVRLILLLILGLTLGNAYSVGIGWAAIEIIYSLIQGFGMGVLSGKTDKKSEEAKAMLKVMGMDKAMEPSAPFWGIMERLSANALHLSFSLALVISPLLVLITAPMHSAANYFLTKLLKYSMAATQLVMLVFSLGLFALLISMVS